MQVVNMLLDHLNSCFRGYNTYSEKATSTFSLAYANAHDYGFMAGAWRSDMGPYPQ